MTDLGAVRSGGECVAGGAQGWELVAPGVRPASAWGTLCAELRAEPSQGVGGCGEVGAIQTEFEEARDTSEAAGAKLCRREWELRSAWFATHAAFEVRSLPRVAGEKNSGKRPSVYNRSVS